MIRIRFPVLLSFIGVCSDVSVIGGFLVCPEQREERNTFFKDDILYSDTYADNIPLIVSGYFNITLNTDLDRIPKHALNDVGTT